MTKEQILEVIGDSLEATTKDLVAENHVIHLYSDLTLMIGKELRDSVNENRVLREYVDLLEKKANSRL